MRKEVILEAIRNLSEEEILPVAHEVFKLLNERNKRDAALELAVAALLDDYLHDKELTALSVLDSESFLHTPSVNPKISQ